MVLSSLMLIAFYGINNIGKTTQAKLLVTALRKQGRRAVYIKYPIYHQHPTGPMINRILRSHRKQKMSEEELQLLFVLNRYQFQTKLKKMLRQGITVVAEDYIGTGIAWGMAKGARQPELELMNKFLVQENKAILLIGKRSMRSKEEKHIHEQDDALVRKCGRILKKLAREKKWKIVKRGETKEETARACAQALGKF